MKQQFEVYEFNNPKELKYIILDTEDMESCYSVIKALKYASISVLNFS